MRKLNQQKFCGWCGSEVSNISEWASKCNSCGYVRYINPSPCSNIIVVRNKEVLMVKRAIEPQLGKYDLPGGYAEVSDDSMEAATLRELKEEIGISQSDVSELIYCGSKKSPPYMWHDTEIQNISFYYACKLKNNDQTFNVDNSENSEMLWVKQEDLPNIEFAWDIDKAMLTKYFNSR